ncbi:unnamed protein product [Rotaria sordida]|uniref:Uncharacterized protein n=1 Tax=Rotaria sordida TaxID=392033 RepID=A0A819CGX6_9BILA|nr:unnamed protein product [Rotaria sordida]
MPPHMSLDLSAVIIRNQHYHPPQDLANVLLYNNAAVVPHGNLPNLPVHAGSIGLVGPLDVGGAGDIVGGGVNSVEAGVVGVLNAVGDVGASDAGGVLPYGEITNDLSASTSSRSHSPSSSLSSSSSSSSTTSISAALVFFVVVFCMSCILFKKDTPRLSFGKTEEEKIGCNSQQTKEVIMNDYQVYIENLIGKETQGFEIAIRNLNACRFNIGNSSLDVTQTSIQNPGEHLKVRKQFDKSFDQFQYMDDCQVSSENLIGKQGQGFEIAMCNLNDYRFNINNSSLNAAQASIHNPGEHLQESPYDVKLEKTFSKMTDDEKQLMIEKISVDVLFMEHEEEILKSTDVKYFELLSERNYKQGSVAEVHFRLAESQFYRLLSGHATAMVAKNEYICNPVLIEQFNKAREELKKKRGEEYSYPILAFHGTAMTNIQAICENGLKVRYYISAFIGRMVDTLLAIEVLVKRFGDNVCKTEFKGAKPSAELQGYKIMDLQMFYRKDSLYDSVIEGAFKTLDDYLHE